MDIFKLVGSIFIKNDEANSQIEQTTSHAQNMATTIGNTFQNVGNKITSIGTALAPVSAVFAGILTASVKSASDFTDGMAKMSTLFDTTQYSVEELGKRFLQLSSATGVSATELAEAGYQALSAGQSVEQVAEFVEIASDLARAGFTSTTTAVDVLTTIINAYGESAGTAEEIANRLVRTQNLGKTTVDELASSMGKIIPTASSMNVSIDNLMSAYVSLTKQGIVTAEATTYMKSMLNELGKSSTDVGKILKEKTGMSFQECMASGMSLADVLVVLQGYANETGINFNELWSSAEAGSSALAILNGGAEEFNETVETMSDDVDDVSEALDKLDTPSVKLKRSLNQLKNSGIELGQALLTALAPMIEKVATLVSKLTTWFGNLSEGTKTTIGTVMALVAGLSPVLIIGGKLISGIGSVISTVGSLVSSLGGLSGVLGAICSPIGLVVVAVGSLVGAMVYLYNTNEDFRNLCQEVWTAVKELISSVIEAIKSLISDFVSAVKAFWAEWGDNITDIASKAWNLIQTHITSALQVIKGIIHAVTSLIKGDWSGVWNGIKETTSAVWNGIKSVTSSAINLVKSVISTGLEGALSVVNSKLTAIKDKFNSIMDGAKTIVSNGINAIRSFFNFSWELPKLKMPHFTVSGKFSLNPLSVPSFGISWYKKAMDDPLMFTKPTLFGMSPNGQMRGAGEAGDEVMIGKDTMLNMIQQAVASESSVYLQKILDVLQNYFPDVIDAVNQPLMWDGHAMAKKLAPAMNTELGTIYRKQKRGV